MKRLELTNKKIVEFYEKNTHLDFEALNLMLIDFIDQLQSNSNTSLSSINTHILSTLNDSINGMTKLETTVVSMKDNIENFSNIKSSHMLQNVQQPLYSYINSSEERINNNISVLKDLTNITQNKQSQLITEMYECITKKSRPSSPMNGHENTDDQLVVSLSQQYCTADLNFKKISNNSASITMKRSMKPTILIYSMNVERNVNQEELKPYTLCIEENMCHGIFLSQNSGISSKDNYNIDINNGMIHVFVHNVNFSIDKIKIAVDIIDNLSIKLKQLNKSEHDISIPKDVLDEINKDFQLFLSQKEGIINVMKESHKKILAQLDEMKFASLEKYLSTKFAPTTTKQGFKCDLCKHFTANNLKALAAHKRGCIRKNTMNIENVIITP
jgi:hypothetical protein